MKDKLKDDILTLCTGYDATYVSKVLAELQQDVVLRHVVRDHEIKACPRCGNTEAYVTDVYHGAGETKHKVALMVFCRACKFHGPKIMKHKLPMHFTETLWRWEAIKAWNNTRIVNFFGVCEDTFGADYQYACNSEEVFELIEALTRYGKLTARGQRPDRQQSNHDIVSEMADVIICIYQLLYTRRVSPEVLNKVMKHKIDRTCQHESVRTAIAELSRRVTEATTITSVHTADESDSINNTKM